MRMFLRSLLYLLLTTIPAFALASGGADAVKLPDLTGSTVGVFSVIIFVLAYLLVMGEEFIHLRKSKPVVLAAGIIWVLVAWTLSGMGYPHAAEVAVRHNILEYAELFLFLLVAMTYINAMEERQVFEALRAWLVRKGFSFRQLFWITGTLAFFISPIADNLTTALIMCAVVLAVGGDNDKFILIGCINIVVAANAGGAFSPFGDITTLMVWQKGLVSFVQFFDIFIPSVVCYVVPAAFMHFAIPNVKPAASDETVSMKVGAKRTIVLFLLTITTAVCFHNFIHLPPMLGMMTGLGYLMFFGYYLKRIEKSRGIGTVGANQEVHFFDVFRKVERAEWDTLLFFYGVILCVGGLSALGYLHIVSDVMYNQWGAGLPPHMHATPANIAVGLLSAVVDNIPVMFAVLTMLPKMSLGQWLLVTLTAGVGGSLLSIGSAAGVALMGQAKGKYTFFGHLRWAWAIALGYVLAIAVHLWLNASLFHLPIK